MPLRSAQIIMARQSCRLLASLSLMTAAFAADPAGWDKTRWGMTSGEIAELYANDVVRLGGRVEFAGLYSDVALRRHSFAGFDFIVYFQMEERTHRLGQVLLERLKQYATVSAWSAVVAALEGEMGPPAARCDRVGKPLDGEPAILERVWITPTTTVRASFISFSATTPERAPQDDGGLGRRLLIRYTPTRAGAAPCP
jgi:hypothetical protein